MSAAGASLVLTLVALLGGTGVLPTGGGGATAYAAGRTPGAQGAMRLSGAASRTHRHASSASRHGTVPKASWPRALRLSASDLRASQDKVTQQQRTPRQPGVPPGTGTGKRIVLDMSDQRVWLVSQSGKTLRTYLVSGSVTDNLKPGSYTVFSRSLHAIGIGDTGTMMYMVRFAYGQNSALGFHDIPVKDGHRVQTRAQLGTPQSHGCIRQARPDAKALWRFAPLNTRVVVTA
ncbi:MAG: hypothetical protein QOJ60_333 [Actinomycetota bacterium]|jgi:lipoprotein-anchoring transpeptidase ErfK/SrfK|nr:hypothetical protein [Actinomycetota bacterium]